jgi:hypothetical protein
MDSLQKTGSNRPFLIILLNVTLSRLPNLTTNPAAPLNPKEGPGFGISLAAL